MSEFSAPGPQSPTTDTTNAQAAPTASPKSNFAKSFRSEEAILVTLIILSTVGIAITNFRPFISFYFWVSMVPVLFLTSLYIGWTKARKRGEGISRIIWVQLLHWVGLLAAIGLIYLLYSSTGRIDNNQLALLTLLSIALATFLAGVHFEWRFMVVGVILGAAVAGAAFIEQVVWMVVIPVAALIVLVIFWWKRSL
ncbi:MAG: hypothetical protein AAF462_07400 [Thermodesulfobacteriota bacterium]